jgi:phosphotriesterase-related protein
LVQTVLGGISSADLGVTLPHEHIFIDERPLWHRPEPGDEAGLALAHASVGIEQLGQLRNDPMRCLDNLLLADEDLAIAELSRFKAAGGASIIDQSSRGMGRDPESLRRVSAATGLHVVMGTGHYVEASHPPEVARLSVERLSDVIEGDIVAGADGTDIRAGVIGEVGVSANMTAPELKALEAAAAAQARTRVPLQVHLPGWHRLGHHVLDIVARAGGDVGATVLCHMTPSLGDRAYQKSLVDRGSWLGYDMVGMDYLFPTASQSPCDTEIAAAIVDLVADGYGPRLLLSSDVFLKMMLVRYGGFGYAHVLTSFADRLQRHGLDEATIDGLLVGNPASLFEVAASTSLAAR